MIWAVMDAFLDTDFPLCPEIITFQHEGQARISWIPRWGSIYNALYILYMMTPHSFKNYFEIESGVFQ